MTCPCSKGNWPFYPLSTQPWYNRQGEPQLKEQKEQRIRTQSKRILPSCLSTLAETGLGHHWLRLPFLLCFAARYYILPFVPAFQDWRINVFLARMPWIWVLLTPRDRAIVCTCRLSFHCKGDHFHMLHQSQHFSSSQAILGTVAKHLHVYTDILHYCG